MASTDSIFRYRAVNPFEEEQSMLFFGRDEETKALSELIFSEKLTVLYSKSGYGKSSLLNAGILPRLRHENAEGQKRYIPIPLRFGAAEENGATLMDKFRFHLGQAMKKEAIAAAPALERATLPDTLWGLFKGYNPASKTRGNAIFVLLFDQFEEFFSYPMAQQVAFKTQLSELIYTKYPPFVRENKKQLSDAENDFLSADLDVRVVFAIREDRLSELDSLSDPLDAILKKRMKLGALNAEQAQKAIEMPAALPNTDGRFRTAPFTYRPEARQRILAALMGNDSQRIESFVLQIICFSIEKTVERQGLAQIGPENLPDFREVFDTYYREQLADMDIAYREDAAQLLEYQLLYYDAVADKKHRRSVDSQELKASPELLAALEQTYLIRREVNSFGRFSYEISHDTLLEPILKARMEKDAAAEVLRREQEQRDAEARAQEAEARAAHEGALRQQAEKQRQFATRRAWGVGFFSVVALVVALWAIKLKRQADHLTEMTSKQKEDLAHTLAEMQKAQAAKQKIEFTNLEKRAETILSAGGCPVDILKEMQDIATTHPDSILYRQNIQTISNNNNCKE